jgi:hypothetical protein
MEEKLTFRTNTARLTTIIIVVCCLVIGGGLAGYFLLKRHSVAVSKTDGYEKPALKRMKNLPPKEEMISLPPPPKYEPDAPLLEQVRRALRDGISPEQAFDMAQSLPENPERADAAFLLLEYAAESGHAHAALQVAGYYDPTNSNPSGTIHKNPETAHEWYQEALTAGHLEVQDNIDKLEAWVSQKAEQGSTEARDLLKAWHAKQP